MKHRPKIPKRTLALRFSAVAWFCSGFLVGTVGVLAEPAATPTVLPLPEAGDAGAGVNPLLTTPPEGLPPLRMDFKMADISPNDLSNWQIARLPARENRDALAAFWTRVSRSKTRWVVLKDPKTGAAVAQEGDNVPSLQEAENAPKSVKLLNDNAELLEIIPSRTWKHGQAWLVAHDTSTGDSQLLLAQQTGEGETLPCDLPIHEVIHLKERVFLLSRHQGKILEMIQRNGKYLVDEFYVFPNRTKVCALGVLPDDRLCVVTRDQLLALSLEKKSEVLLRNPGWAAYEPNSVLYDDKAKRVFVGMRHFVARCAIEGDQRASVLLRPIE